MRTRRLLPRLLTLALTIALAVSIHAKNAAELQLALRRLTVVGGALYVAAHPDDENTAMLAWLANERLLRTGYLSVTRGDGGQNLIGDETGPLLGLIRTQELLAARRIDGAEQMFTRAIDFGYSKSPEETLATWGRDEALADVVWAIRRFQPDVIITRFPTTGEGGHGHHTSSAILAEEAFAAAADGARYPGQSAHAAPWQAQRIFWNMFSRQPLDPKNPALATALRVDLGTFNPLLGRAYTELAAESRSQHKSQGFGSAERRGSVINYLVPRAGSPATADLLEGIDTRWSRYPGGERVGTLLEQAATAFDPDKPAASVPLLLQAYAQLERLRADPAWSDVKKPWVAGKYNDLQEAIRDCAGIAIDVSAARSTVTPGGELPVSVTVVNRSNHPFRLAMVASLYARPSKAPGTRLEYNQPVKTDINLVLPADYPWSQPYWLAQPHPKGLYNVSQQRDVGRPENKTEVPILVTLDDPLMNTLIFTVPAVFRHTDPVAGEQVRKVDVVPPVSVELGSNVSIFPDVKPRPVNVLVRSFVPATGSVRLRMPAGWKADPESIPLNFVSEGSEARVTFAITPPPVESAEEIVAEVTLSDGRSVSHRIVDIDYSHIAPQRVFVASSSKVVRADIRKRGSRVGYIMGSGDDVPDILRQVGYEVVLLDDADLDRGDFARFDAIVTGIRAYNTRERLRIAHQKLMEYVADGGTMVVQYNTLDDLAVASPGPFPLKLSRDRVTVEEAPVRFVDPRHPLLTTPNRIAAKDFEGWVQERGLYFPGEWDSKYAPVLASNDPGENEKTGGELYARHGKGVFIYSAYSWWRQLPAGVPGAIRAFVNLVSAE